MSIFSYAGIGMALVRTKAFKVEPEYDNSGVDLKWPKYTISVLGLLAPTPLIEQLPYNDASVSTTAATAAELAVSLGLDAAVAQAAAAAAAQAAVEAAKAQRKRGVYDYSLPPSPAGTGEGYGAFVDEIKARLMTPRQELYYQNGSLTLRSPGPDANLGPKPLSCSMAPLTGGYFLVEFAISACLPECKDNPIPSPVVSLKWSQSESFDENWLSTVTTRGKLVVRSDLRQSADSFRHLCVPGMLADFRRESIEFTLSESGCELGFSVVDKELPGPLPGGVTRAEGQCVIVVSKGALRRGQVDVTLGAPKGVSRADLMSIATRMCLSKLRFEGLQATPIIGGSFRESLFKPEVSVSLQCNNLVQLGSTVSTGAVRSAGRTPGVVPGNPPLAPPVRSRLIALLSAPFFDPCSGPGTQPARSTTPSATVTSSSAGGTTTTTVPGVDAPGTQLVTGGTVGMSPSASVVASSVASSTPAGPTAFPSAHSAATISIEVVDEVTDPDTKDAIDFTDAAPYDYYFVDMDYAYDTGARVLPGTGTGPNPKRGVAVTEHGGQMVLEVVWSAQRKVIPPVVPRFQVPSKVASNFVPMRSRVGLPEVDIAADGRTPVYTIAGKYEYGILDPDQVNVVSAVPPFLTDTAAQAAKQTAGFNSDDVVWRFQGEGGGPNPFTAATTNSDPGNQVAKALGSLLAVAGIPSPPAFVEPEFDPEGAD